MSFDISVLGMADFEADWNAIPDKIQAGPLRKALRAGARLFETAIVATAPRASGRMAETIEVKAKPQARKGIIRMVVLTGTREALGIPYRTKRGAPRGYYPMSIEYGWFPSNVGRTEAAKRRSNFLARARRHGVDAYTGRDIDGAIVTGSRNGHSYDFGKRLQRILAVRDRKAELGGHRVAANPFMRRAFEQTKAAALDVIAATLRAEVPKAIEKALDKAADRMAA